MKKISFTILSMLLLAACGTSDDSSIHGQDKKPNYVAADTHSSSEDKQAGSSKNVDTSIEHIKEFQEYPYLEETVHLSDYQVDIIEDNSHKRIILLENENGEKKYKSIFIKDTDRLKIVEFDRGLLFNYII